jgi:biotin synthase
LAELAAAVRRRFAAAQMDLCAIINAKSGNCCEDCSYCTQSARFKTEIAAYPMLPQESMLRAARQAEADGVNHFCLVTSGRGMEPGPDLDLACETLDAVSRGTKLARCASFGLLDEATAKRLKEAGLNRYHHNIETSERHFPAVCTTHSYQDRIRTIRTVQAQGLEVCAGGILGMGETLADRVDMAFSLRELKVESIPLNILNAFPGTPLNALKDGRIRALDAVKAVAMFRLANPTAIIRLAGGRVLNLGEHERLALAAGINGLLVGNYLTSLGPSVQRDKAMFKEMGFLLAPNAAPVPKAGAAAGVGA